MFHHMFFFLFSISNYKLWCSFISNINTIKCFYFLRFTDYLLLFLLFFSRTRSILEVIMYIVWLIFAVFWHFLYIFFLSFFFSVLTHAPVRRIMKQQYLFVAILFLCLVCIRVMYIVQASIFHFFICHPFVKGI